MRSLGRLPLRSFTRHATLSCAIALLTAAVSGQEDATLRAAGQQQENTPIAGADERTPSYSQYFSWINNTNEGGTEEQVLLNLDFFQWLHDEYGMVLDIYVISAGTIDKAGRYGMMDSDAFRRQFRNGLCPIHEKASAIGTRLVACGGPDGFGNTPDA